jgi:hypothetical protein
MARTIFDPVPLCLNSVSHSRGAPQSSLSRFLAKWAARNYNRAPMRIVARCLLVALGSAVACLWAVAGASPQTSITGAIVGTAKDTNGAVVPNASVDALNLATHMTLSTTTDTNGRYTLDNARPGRYTIQVMARGFSPYKQENVIVEAGRRRAQISPCRYQVRPRPSSPPDSPTSVET